MIAIIDYNSGNLKSVANALTKIGKDCVITADPAQINNAEKIIFPGQGRAGPAMESIRKMGIDKLIKETKKPFLGICIGMQLLVDYSEEDEGECLKIIPGKVQKFTGQKGLKVPQVGWNSVTIKPEGQALFKEIPANSHFYFVNSYYAKVYPQYSLGQTTHGEIADTVIQKDNFYGLQFHVEKSGDAGLQLLKNFCNL